MKCKFLVMCFVVVSCRGINNDYPPANHFKSVLLLPSPTREFIFKPEKNEYVITYPYWIDKFYLTFEFESLTQGHTIFSESGAKLENPIDLRYGLNTFKVKLFSKNKDLGKPHTFFVTRNPWKLISQNAPYQARDGAGVVVFKNKIWLLGGWLGDGGNGRPSGVVSEIWSSDNGVDWISQVMRPGLEDILLFL